MLKNKKNKVLLIIIIIWSFSIGYSHSYNDWLEIPEPDFCLTHKEGGFSYNRFEIISSRSRLFNPVG